MNKNKLLASVVLVLIVLGIILAIYFSTKSTKKSGDGKPELEFDSNGIKTINPREKSSGSEGYRIEYASADESSNFIDLTLKWTNGQGFNDVVTKLIFTRTVDGEPVQSPQETNETIEISDYGTGKVTFKGSDVFTDSSVKGKNVITAYYNEIADVNKLASAEIEVTEYDLNFTLVGPFGDLEIPVSISKDEFNLNKNIKKTYYQISHAPGYWFNTISLGDDKYQFKFDDGTFLKIGDKDMFKLSAYKGKKVLSSEDGSLIWVYNKQAWLSINDFTKDDYRFAQCELIGANLIVSTGSSITPSDSVLYKSPNGEFKFIWQMDGNMVVRGTDERDISATYSQGKGGTTLKVDGNGNLAMRDAADIIVWESGYQQAKLLGTSPPYSFIISDFGGLHVIAANGRELVYKDNLFGFSSNFYKTHLGDLLGYNLGAEPTKKNIFECARECVENINCAGFTHDGNQNKCSVKGYGTRILGVAPNNPDQNANRWSNFDTTNGTTDWSKSQYYQKKVDTVCYRDRYPDLQFGDDAKQLNDHYFYYGMGEGRNMSCDTTRPKNSNLGFYNSPASVAGSFTYLDAEFDGKTRMSAQECKDFVKEKGQEVWGYRTPAHGSNDYQNTCFAYTKGEIGLKATLTGDGNHFTGCVNGKTLKSGCTQDV
jgi:hypothetical protein